VGIAKLRAYDIDPKITASSIKMKTEVLWWRSYTGVEEIKGLLEEVDVNIR